MSKVEMRRLSFQTVEEGMAEAERLASTTIETTGNYTFGQIVEHLARTLDLVSGRVEPPFKVSLPMRFLARMVRPKLLKQEAQPGFQLPKKAQAYFWPTEDVDTDAAVAHLRESFAAYQGADTLPKHIFFGSMTRQQHDLFQRRHFELHLGFVRPVS